MDSKDRVWITSKNRISREYTVGLNSFLAAAKNHLDSEGKTVCPCVECQNRWPRKLSTIQAHILAHGMMATYQRWIHHGEPPIETPSHFEDTSDNNEDDNTLGDAIVDEEGRMFFNIGPLVENQVEDELNTNERAANRGRFDEMVKKLNKELYPGSGSLTLLQYIVKLMHIKVLNTWSDKSLNMLLQFERSIVPPGHNLPTSYYEMKRILMEIGLGYHNIDVCIHDCALFYKEYGNLLACPVCDHPRYKRNKVPFKRMRYFPLIPRLQRLYSSRHTSEDMRWHAEKRMDEEGVLRHPADGEAWKDFDSTYPTFAADSRNVRLGLTSDGFNHFGNMSVSYSTWPVMVKVLNFPPWKMMHQTNYMMCLLIPGPKSPGIEKKSKDTIKARMDLEDLGIRKELWLQKSGSGVVKKPHAGYTFTKEEKISFLDFLRSVRLPDGYASNISRCVTSDWKLTNLKTHDSHILLQNLLPAGIVGLLCKNARVAIIELCNFFRRLCARTLLVSEIQELKKGIVVILCKLEKIFPPSFFTIMVHLCIHLPDQALLGGPVASRWMYSAERCLGTYKRYVRNTASPEGSIAEAYVVDEALTYLSLYIEGMETKFTRPERNIDHVDYNESSNIALFKARLRCFGTSQLKFLRSQSNALEWYILNNCHEDIKPYLDEHMDILKENFSNDLEKLQSKTFPTWFKSKMEELRQRGSMEATDDMYSLALGPFDRYNSWTSCIVNGVRFHSQFKDDNHHTQNCGISVPGNHDGKELDFYGVLVEVMELSYILNRKVVIFRCKWYNTNERVRNIRREHDLTSIKIDSEWYTNDPYILAMQARQVFYLADMRRDKNWRIVQKISHRHMWDVPIVDTTNEGYASAYHAADTSPSMFVASENDFDDTVLVRTDVEPTIMAMTCDESVDQFINDDDEDNGSEEAEPMFESGDDDA